MPPGQPVLEEGYGQEQYPPQYMQQPPPPTGMVAYPGQDPQFLKWLFSFKSEVTIPLRFLWRGYEQGEDGVWRKKSEDFRIMNEAGITWAISFIESFINPVYIVSNYSDKDINWTMKHVGRSVYNNLSCRYQEFGLHKLDINRVGIEIVSKVHAILLGAKENGYRKFFSTTHQHQEVKSFNENQQSGGGLFGMFRGLRGGGRNEPQYG
jgi:hypothetical protein